MVDACPHGRLGWNTGRESIKNMKYLEMNRITILSITLLLALSPLLSSGLRGQSNDNGLDKTELSVIADHTVVEKYDSIPQYWINKVKKMLLCIPGESHGTAYLYGFALLEQQQNRFVVKATWAGAIEAPTDQYLRVVRTYIDSNGNWNRSGGEEDFWTWQDAVNMMNSFLYNMNRNFDNRVHAFGFAWCWDMTASANRNLKGWAGTIYYGDFNKKNAMKLVHWGLSADDSLISMDDYIEAVEHYNRTNPDTITFFTTGPVDGYEGVRGYQRFLKHEYIRQYVKNAHEKKYLFDYADILTHNDAGEHSTYSQFARRVPIIHPDNWGPDGRGYNGGNGYCHINETGCLRLGKALWWMLARMAGWDGVPEE